MQTMTDEWMKALDALRDPYQSERDPKLYHCHPGGGNGRCYVAGMRDGTLYTYHGGVITDLVRYVFTHGHCHLLAIELHRKTGWPIVYTGYSGAHYGVQMPDGRVLDINGATPADEWWFGIMGTTTDLELPRSSLRTCGAKSFVKPLLESVGQGYGQQKTLPLSAGAAER